MSCRFRQSFTLHTLLLWLELVASNVSSDVYLYRSCYTCVAIGSSCQLCRPRHSYRVALESVQCPETLVVWHGSPILLWQKKRIPDFWFSQVVSHYTMSCTKLDVCMYVPVSITMCNGVLYSLATLTTLTEFLKQTIFQLLTMCYECVFQPQALLSTHFKWERM